MDGIYKETNINEMNFDGNSIYIIKKYKEIGV